MSRPSILDIQALIEQAEKLKQEVVQLNKNSFLTPVQSEAIKAGTDIALYLLQLSCTNEEECENNFGIVDNYFTPTGSMNRGRFARSLEGLHADDYDEEPKRIELYNPNKHKGLFVRYDFDEKKFRCFLNQYTMKQKQLYWKKHIQPLIVQLDTDLTPWLPFIKPYIDTEGIQKAIKTAEPAMLSHAIYQFKKTQKVIETEAKQESVGTEQQPKQIKTAAKTKKDTTGIDRINGLITKITDALTLYPLSKFNTEEYALIKRYEIYREDGEAIEKLEQELSNTSDTKDKAGIRKKIHSLNDRRKQFEKDCDPNSTRQLYKKYQESTAKHKRDKLPSLQKELRNYLDPRWDELLKHTTEGYPLREKVEYFINAVFGKGKGNVTDKSKELIGELELIQARLEHAQTQMPETQGGDEKPAGTGQIIGPAKEPPKEAEYVFQKTADTWTITYDNITQSGINHIKGMLEIAFLLGHPNKPPIEPSTLRTLIDADVDLQAFDKLIEKSKHTDDMGYTGVESIQEMAKPQAVFTCYLRLKEIDEEREKVESNLEMADLDNECECIRKYLNQITHPNGKGGFIIKNFPTQANKDKKTIHQRIRRAKKNIQKHHPKAYKHLDDFITCDSTCIYKPHTKITWIT